MCELLFILMGGCHTYLPRNTAPPNAPPPKGEAVPVRVVVSVVVVCTLVTIVSPSDTPDVISVCVDEDSPVSTVTDVICPFCSTRTVDCPFCDWTALEGIRSTSSFISVMMFACADML